jgi:hypothetical protein
VGDIQHGLISAIVSPMRWQRTAHAHCFSRARIFPRRILLWRLTDAAAIRAIDQSALNSSTSDKFVQQTDAFRLSRATQAQWKKIPQDEAAGPRLLPIP